MSNEGLNIEKMNVDVFAIEHPSPQKLLHQITAEFQHLVLPKLENELNDFISKNRLNTIVLDRLDVHLNFADGEDYMENLVQQLATQLVSEVEKKVDEQQLATSEHITRLKSEQAWFQICYFYRWGYFPLVVKDKLPISLEIWENELKNDNIYTEIVNKSAFFIRNDQKALERFLNQHSISFIRDTLSLFFTEIEADFFMTVLQLNAVGHKFANELLFNFFQLDEAETKGHVQNAVNKTVKRSTEYSHFLHKMEIEAPLFYKKHQKIIENSLKVSQDFYGLKGQLKLFCQPELFSFIEYLRTDFHLRRKLDPILSIFFSTVSEKKGLQNWVVEFVCSINKAAIIENMLIDFKEMQHFNDDNTMPDYYSPELQLLIGELDKRHKVLPKTETPASEQLKQPNVENIDLPAHSWAANAGIILLNPFLPTLFKNLHLQNEKGVWLSKRTQAAAIYIIHYLATGNLDTTEDQLNVAKILTGFEFEEVLPNWEVISSQYPHPILEKEWLTQLNEIEIPEILNAIHQNWYPMRNCTWSGLQNDFLTRPGVLELQENKQYILTVEPHVLDVLLPHIKWGTSMIKYSWMEEVLNVEWL